MTLKQTFLMQQQSKLADELCVCCVVLMLAPLKGNSPWTMRNVCVAFTLNSELGCILRTNLTAFLARLESLTGRLQDQMA